MEQGISSDCWATQPMLSGDMQNELAMLFAKLCEFALKSQWRLSVIKDWSKSQLWRHLQKCMGPSLPFGLTKQLMPTPQGHHNSCTVGLLYLHSWLAQWATQAWWWHWIYCVCLDDWSSLGNPISIGTSRIRLAITSATLLCYPFQARWELTKLLDKLLCFWTLGRVGTDICSADYGIEF